MKQMKRLLSVWRYSLAAVGWWMPILGLLGMVILAAFVTARDPIAQLIGFSAVAAAGACVSGIQAAFAFAPNDEPALELLLSAPRPLWILICERLALVLLLNVALAVVGAVMFVGITGMSDVGAQLVRWFAPCIAMMGFGFFIGMVTRRSNYGALCVILIIGATLFGGMHVLMVQFPFLWVFDPFLEASRVAAADYALNRAVLIALGAALIVSALSLTRNEEQLLEGKG